MGIILKAQMGAKSAFGHTILTEILERMSMNLMNMYFVYPGSILRYFMKKNMYYIPGMNFSYPKGVPHHGKVKKGTRTIHAFGGKRIV